MSLYAVKNDEGKWLRTDTFGTVYWKDEIYDAEQYIEVLNAHHDAKRSGGHVVELFDAPDKVVASEEEAEMLEQAKCDDDPAELIVGFVNSHDKYDDDRKAEDRLMHAYVNGWTVEKEKRYQLKVPYADGWIFQKYSPESKLKHHNYSKPFPVRDTELIGRQLELTRFTMAEIQHYDLQGCERMEVTDDDAKK